MTRTFKISPLVFLFALGCTSVDEADIVVADEDSYLYVPPEGGDPDQGCEAHRWCSSSGQWISCTGSASDCAVGSNYVVCDGTVTFCPTGTPCGNGVCDSGETYSSCPPDCDPPLTLDLSHGELGACNANGPGVEYDLTANASGGSGSYSFSWSGASQQSSPSADPNLAVSVFSSQNQYVSVTVSSGGQSASDSVTLYMPSYCDGGGGGGGPGPM